MTTWRLESMWTRTLSTTISTSPFSGCDSSLAMARLSHADPVRRPELPRRGPPPDRPHDEPDHDAGEEATDVLEDRDAAGRALDPERGDPVDQLEQEPEPEDDDGRHLEELVEEAEEDEREDPRPGVENEIGSEDGGDRPRCPDDRHLRRRRDRDLRQRGDSSAKQVEEQEADPAEAILDVVAEDPQVQHVADQVQPAAVEERA